MHQRGTGTCLRYNLTPSHFGIGRETPSNINIPNISISISNNLNISSPSYPYSSYSTYLGVSLHNVYFLHHSAWPALTVPLVSTVMCLMYCTVRAGLDIASVGILGAYRKHPTGTSTTLQQIYPNAADLLSTPQARNRRG